MIHQGLVDIKRTWNHGEFSFFGQFLGNFRNKQVEKNYTFFGKKIYYPIFVMKENILPRKMPGK